MPYSDSQLSGHLRFSHEWRFVRCYSQDHYNHNHNLQLSIDSSIKQRAQSAQTSALLCRFSTGIVMMRSVGRSLTEIESVARQIWTSLGASGGCSWPFSPPQPLWTWSEACLPSGPFKGLTSHQPGLLMEPFLHFMDAWSLISIKIIRFYLVLYIAQTVPTHPESFQTDRSRNRRYVKWIGNALPYENLNRDILFNSYWSSFFNSLIGGLGQLSI